MLTGEIRSQIDGIWNAFWSGGISNPIGVIEQITYSGYMKLVNAGLEEPGAQQVAPAMTSCDIEL